MLVSRNQQNGENLDAEELRQEELEKLLKQYHIIDGTKSVSTIANRKILHRQMNELALLEKERRDLQANYLLTQSARNQNADNKVIDEIKALLIILERKEGEIGEELRRQQELEGRIVEWERRTNLLKAAKGPTGQAVSRNRVRNLESRLQKMVNDYGVCLTKNRSTRRNLNDLCFQQKKFESHRIKIGDCISQCRQEIAQAISSSTAALEAKDEYSAKTSYLREKSERDEKQHLAEMKELTRIIDHEKQLKKFMSDKTAERHNDGQMVAWKQGKITRAVQKRMSERDSLTTLEEAYYRITQLMDTTSIEQIIKKFDEREESNFALFKFVNEQNNRLDKLASEIEEINQETESSKREFEQLERRRQAELGAMESQLSRFSKVNDSYRRGIEETEGAIGAFVEEIKLLLGGIDCRGGMPKNAFGEFDEVTRKNVVVHMQAIEDKVNQMIAVSNYIQTKEQGSPKKLNFAFVPKRSIRAQQSPPVLPAPDFTLEDDNVSYYEIRPLSKKELQNRVNRKIRANFNSQSWGIKEELSFNDKKLRRSPSDVGCIETNLVEDN